MIGERIAEARKALSLSQQQLADRLGTSQPTIQRYESNERDLNSEKLIAMSAALGVTISYLLGFDDDQVIPNRAHVMHSVPVLGRIAAGEAREAIQQAGEWHATRDELWRDHERAFWLVVSGNSMNRLFPEGSLVLIDPDEEVRDGDVGALFVNGDDATLKRVFFEGETVRLHPESHDAEYRDRVIDRSDPDAPDVRAIGRAVSYTAPDGWRA
ncbi:LexA family protein [Olsenella uli]